MTRGLHAWIDESVHVQGPEPGFYVLVASIGEVSGAPDIRGVLRALVVNPSGRLHWNAETNKTRDVVAEVIAGLDLVHLAVVRFGTEAKRQERARRKCLERLLWELDQRGVGRVLLESRQGNRDRHDQRMVEAVRGARLITSRLVVDFARPLDEPMVWLPDAVAGMTAHALRYGNDGWLERLGSAYEQIVV